jgi:hypothetical protein
MSAMQMTYRLACAAAQDAGDRAMRKGGRKVWSAGDYRRACEELERLWPSPDASGDSAALELRS